MFVECGSVSDAEQVFNRLVYRNEYSWTSLIQGYLECGEWQHALNLYREMQKDCVNPSRFTFVALLKACARLKYMETGREIHAEIAKDGYERDLFIGSTLVDMYAKCSSLAEAREVFDELPVRDVVSWNALLTGYAEHVLGEEVLYCLEQMGFEGVSKDITTFVHSLKTCGSIGAIDCGRELHAEITKEGFEKDCVVGNILVDMYAKCGSLVEAREVFGKLPVQDVVSWTSLIARYAEHGLGEEALNCLKQMQLEGVPPDAVTFVCSLKACGSIGAIDRVREIQSEIVKQGSESDPFVGNILTDIYAKRGFLSEAQEVFDKLPVRDVFSWNAIIAGYAEHGLCEEALKCFQLMQLEDMSPDAVTFVCGLKACGSIGAIHKGQEIEAEIAKRGFEGDPFVGSALVDMYAKCGSLIEAREIFDKLPFQDVVSWTALIAGYVEHGLGEEALNCLEQMQLEGVSKNAVTFICSLKACGSTGAIGRGREIHTEIAKEGYERDHFVGNTLVDMYAKCGSLVEAQEVADKLPVRDVVSWNALIAGYAEDGLVEETLNGLQQMQLQGESPVPITFVCSLKACGSAGAIDRGRELHAEIAKNCFEREAIVGNMLVDMYAKCGSLVEAWEVFDKLPVRDVVTWTALIAGYAEHGLGEEVSSCLEQMQVEGVSPDAVTFICSLRVCGTIGAKERGQKMHIEIVQKEFERDPFVGNTLVDMYARCGSLAEAVEVFDKLPFRDVVSWNSLIAGFTEHGLLEEAHNCFQEMQLEGVSRDVVSWNSVILGYAEQGEDEKAFKLYAQMQEQGLLPNSVVFVSILKACGNTADLKSGKKVHAQVYRIDGLEVTLANALIGMYGKCGNMIGAQQLFDAMPTRSLVTWNTLITGYARQGESEVVFRLFQRMREQGIQPDAITFLSVLTVCSHAGLVDKGKKYFESMSKEYGITSSVKHHNCMVDLLGRAGQLDEGVAMFEKMSFQPDFVVWSTILGACQKWGNVELGRQAFECVVQSDEKHSASFILMSNIYADALL